jgi:hypothetical protein
VRVSDFGAEKDTVERLCDGFSREETGFADVEQTEIAAANEYIAVEKPTSRS